uniref:PhoD-like phosphatase metallophosphatase domain-containing protein n=1 Tax=Globisporangium ultimum (strain ATCC 200006 / CBS 805.95 / DAOM BR144) TaxID=431595 RepID=K3WK28_GLOUD
MARSGTALAALMVLMHAPLRAMSALFPTVDLVATPLQRVAFGSCNDQAEKQPLWNAILARDPQLWLWMGDVIYGDYKDMRDPMAYIPPFHFFRDATPEMLKDNLQALNDDFMRFRQTVPIIAVWDDHDFGINDGGKTYPYREQSQNLFLDFVGEPKDSSRRHQQGVYTSYTIGTGERTVKFILLDVRYNKDPYDIDDGDFLGAAQWAWLERELATSLAAFNVLVSGVQILPTDRFYGGEHWHRFERQRMRLLGMILKSNAKGVILLSGDVHFAEINQVQCDDYKNLITEVTSSGMTHSVEASRASSLLGSLPGLVFRIANALLPLEFRPHRHDYYGGLNFGELEFDWEAHPVPTAMARIVDAQGNTQLTYTFASQYFETTADVDAAAFPGRSCLPIQEQMGPVVFTRSIVFLGVVALLLASIPMAILMLLGVLLVVFRRSFWFMHALQRSMFDSRYQKID